MTKLNYCKKHGLKVLADPTYGKVSKCKECGTPANLDKGLCEACHYYKFNKQNYRFNANSNKTLSQC